MNDIERGAMAGAIGGLIGSTAMVAFNHLLGASGYGRADLGRHGQQHRVEAKPNDTDGTIADEPASIRAASHIAEMTVGTPLRGRERRIGGSIVHHAFGLVAGAVYGALAARVPAVTAGAGTPYGAVVWITGAETGVPLAGLAGSPDEYPLSRHAASLATHLVFGATVEAVRRWLAPAPVPTQ